MDVIKWQLNFVLYNFGLLVRASGRSQKKCQISRDFQGQTDGKNGRFRGNFAGIFKATVLLKNDGKERLIS